MDNELWVWPYDEVMTCKTIARWIEKGDFYLFQSSKTGLGLGPLTEGCDSIAEKSTDYPGKKPQQLEDAAKKNCRKTCGACTGILILYLRKHFRGLYFLHIVLRSIFIICRLSICRLKEPVLFTEQVGRTIHYPLKNFFAELEVDFVLDIRNGGIIIINILIH